MKVEVRLVNEKGRGIQARDRAGKPKYCGVLQVREERVQSLGRAVVIAHLVSSTDGVDTPLLPALHDASMLFVRGGQIRVRGFEMVDGIQYGQTWDIKVP